MSWLFILIGNYGNIGSGVSSSGIQKEIGFCLQVNTFKGNFDIFWKRSNAEPKKIGHIFTKKPFQTWLIWKVPIIKKIVLLGEKSTLDFSSQQVFD